MEDEDIKEIVEQYFTKKATDLNKDSISSENLSTLYLADRKLAALWHHDFLMNTKT